MIHPNDAGEGSTHSDIGNVRGSTRENFLVSGLDVGVGSNNCGGSAIGMKPKGDFLTGCFGVKIEEAMGSLYLFIEAVEFSKWVIESIHENSPADVDNSQFYAFMLQITKSFSWGGCGIIDRSYNL